MSLGTNYFAVRIKSAPQPPVHIGKASAGRRFSFYIYDDGYECMDSFSKWQKWLAEQVMSNKYLIVNEYGEAVELGWLIGMIEKKQEFPLSDEDDAEIIDGYSFRRYQFR